MDSFELNKIAGAVLLSLLIVMGLGIISDIIFEPHEPEKPGFEIAVATATEEPEAGGATEVVPIGVRLTEASAEAGEKAVKKCAACHNFEKGGANKVGPHLWGVVGRPIAGVEDFSYSDALKDKSGETWSFEHLDAFVTSPKDFAKGTKMSFPGLSKESDRHDLLAYLRTLSDNPVPLPE